MRPQHLALILVLGTSLAARAALYTETFSSGFADNGNIPDGSTGGWSDTRAVSGITVPDSTISSITVTLNISGGYNGDLYGYLSYDGHMLVLLNQVGTATGSSSSPTFYFGYADAGFNNVTLSDSGSVNIHDYGGGGVPTGTFLPDSGGVTFASTFGGLDPNGNWTLFLSDMSGGGGQSQVTSWSLGINTVPEPVNMALAVFGALLAVPSIFRRLKSARSASRS